MLSFVPQRFLRTVNSLESEEQFLNGGALLALLGMFLPWMSGEWLGGDSITYSGFGFYTSFLGLMVFLLELALLLITLIPLLGGPVIIKKRQREVLRLCLSSAATLLVLSALSVLMKVSFEFTRMELRFGIYVTLVGCIVTLVYSFLRFQEQRRMTGQELFRHPEDEEIPTSQENLFTPPPPPPPPKAPEAEDHRLYP